MRLYKKLINVGVPIALASVFTIVLAPAGSSRANFALLYNQLMRADSGSAATATPADIYNIGGIQKISYDNSDIGANVSINANNNVFEIKGNSCAADRFHVYFSGNVGDAYGLGNNDYKGSMRLLDTRGYGLDLATGTLLDIDSSNLNDTTQTVAYRFDGDTGRMKLPVFIFPKQNLIIAYIQSQPKLYRFSYDASQISDQYPGSTLVIKRKYADEGGCAPLVIAKGSSMQETYAKFTNYLRTNTSALKLNNTRKPHYKAFGLGWETYDEFGCYATKAKIESLLPNYKNNNVPISMVAVGSGYWESTNVLNCGDGTSVENIYPTMDGLQTSANKFGGLAGINQFFANLEQNYGAYGMIGMRHTVNAGQISGVTDLTKPDAHTLAVASKTGNIPDLFFSNIGVPYGGYRFYGDTPSTNVRILNMDNSQVKTNYVAALHAAYGNFKGIKEDEMLHYDQRTVKAANQPRGSVSVPEGYISKIFQDHYRYANNDFIIWGQADWFLPASDIQYNPGWVPADHINNPVMFSQMSAGFNYVTAKYMLELALTRVVSGYPHVVSAINSCPISDPATNSISRYQTDWQFCVNANKNPKEVLRTNQLMTFWPGNIQSYGFWHLGEPYRSDMIFYGQLRDRLHKYMFDSAMYWHNTGVPYAMRPLFFDYQSDSNVYKLYDDNYDTSTLENQFLVGNAFMVRPIYNDSDTVLVYFPANSGEWYNFYSGQRFTPGYASYTLTASKDYPMFVKAGEPFIMQESPNENATRTRVRMFIPSGAYSKLANSAYQHYDKSGNIAGKVEVSMNDLGSLAASRQAIKVYRKIDGVIVADLNSISVKNEIKFDMEEGKDYLITNGTYSINRLPTGSLSSVFSPTFNTINLSGSASDPDTASPIAVRVYLDGVLKQSISALSFNQTLVQVPGGTHTVKVTALDATSGQEVELVGSPKIVIVSNPPVIVTPVPTPLPTVASTPRITPVPSSNIGAITLRRVSGTDLTKLYLVADVVSSQSILKVEFYINNILKVTEYKAPYSLGGDADGVIGGYLITPGSHTVKAIAYAAGGAIGQNSLTVTVEGAIKTPTAVQSNIIVNGSFESGTISGWTTDPALVINLDAHQGVYAVMLGQSSAYLSQSIQSKLVANKSYTFTSYVKVTKAGTSWGSPRLRISKYVDLGTSEYGYAVARNSVSAGWQKLSIVKSFTTTELSLPIHFGVKNFGFDGKAQVDNIYVQ